ncbi:MAG: flagellar basal body-associated FliL family protein [Enterobacterales bacterium]|nr:flagellar basal body-associated FliL family protein [Enterobacterales bacterium]
MSQATWVKNLLIFGLFSFFLMHFQSIAEEDGEEKPEEVPLMYFEVDPNILTFYQGTGRKLGYVVVQVNIVVRGQDNYDLVELHLPLIQDRLIDFFNRQDKSVIQPFEEREKLRVGAKEAVSAVLKEETGKDVVENLLFTNYVFQ